MRKLLKRYSGDALIEPKAGLEAYIPDGLLVQAVNIAAFLGRPLLLTGDPGCGKTRLAEAIAFEWYGENYKKFLFRWDVKSISKARDGLYTFNNLNKLYDIQSGAKTQNNKGNSELKPDTAYRSFGKLGDSFRLSDEDSPCILLIDEIDKAPIDFPNDLLLELDEKKFSIPETEEIIEAKFPPLVIITSNSEKELPAAFLRRCIYHHIEFPKEKILSRILMSHRDEIDSDLIEHGLKVFISARNMQENQNLAGEKLVSTSEMLDWFKFISHVKNKDKDKIMNQLKNNQIPYYQALFKKREDHNLFSEKLIKPDNKIQDDGSI